MRRLNFGRTRPYYTIILTDYCASYITYQAVVPKFATISHGAPPVLSNIYYASKLNPLFYFAIGSLLCVMEKCKILLKKRLSMSTFFVSVACNTSSFDQNMVLIFTRLRTKGNGQISSCFTFGCFCFGYPLRFWAAITHCF